MKRKIQLLQPWRHLNAMFCVILLLSLTSGCLPDREPTAPTEIDRPVFQSLSPKLGAMAVNTGSVVKMLFNERMDLESFQDHFVLKDAKGISVRGVFAILDTAVTFAPETPLAQASRYYAVLRGRVRDAQRSSISLNLGGEPILDDATLIDSTWFYTEGKYSKSGFFRLYVRDRQSGSVRVLGNLDEPIAQLGRFAAPEGMALSSDGNWLYVSSTNSDSVAVINAQQNSITKMLSVGEYPSAMTSIGNYVYVICINGSMVVKINASTQSIEKTFSLGFFPGQLAASQDGGTLYSIDQVTRDLVLINANDGTVVKRVPNGTTQVVKGELNMHSASGKVFVCDARGHRVMTLAPNATAFQTVQTFAGGIEPLMVAFDASSYFVVAGKTIYRYDLNSNVLIGSISFTGTVKSVAVLPSYDLLYATVNSNVAIVDIETMTGLREIGLPSSGIESVISSISKF